MNIFFLDKDPAFAAQYHCDKHVNKMIVEHLQMMSVALDHYGLKPAHKKDGSFYSTRAYKNHPCTKWVKESSSNFLWLWDLTLQLCNEFSIRYNKPHAGEISLFSIHLEHVEEFFPNQGLTEAAQAMPDFCKVPGDPVQAYRNYYNWQKWKFATWKIKTPSWWAPSCFVNAKSHYE